MHRIARTMILLGSAVALVGDPARLWAQSLVAPATQPADAPTPIVVIPVQSAPPAQPPGTALVVTPAEPSGQPAPGGGPQPLIITAEPTTAPTTEPAKLIKFNFQDAPIDTVLEHLSDVAGFIVVKPGPIVGRVTILSVQPVTPAIAVQLLNTELQTLTPAYTAIQMGPRLLKVVPIAQARKMSIPVIYTNNPNDIEPNDTLVTCVIPVRNLDAVKLKTDLAPLIGVDTDLTSNASSNSLVMTDTQANIRRVVEIVSNLDKRDTLENTIHVKQLKYADATAAAKLITDIFNAGQSTGSSGGGGGPGGGGGGGGRGGGGPGGGGGGPGAFFRAMAQAGQPQEDKGQLGKVTASADTRTNTVVVSGPTDTLKVIDEVLNQLDNNPAADEVFFIYPVRNGQAVDIQATLNQLFGNSTGTSTSSNSNSSGFGAQAFGTGGTSSGRSGSSGGSFGGGSSGGSGLGTGAFGGSSTSTGGTNRTTGGGGGGFGGGGGAFGSQSNGPPTATSALKNQVYVVADADTNSLLVATATKYKQQVLDILKELDRPVPQVLIKVLIASVEHDNSIDIGADFSVLNLRPSGNGQTGSTIFGNALAATAAKTTGAGGAIVSIMEDNFTATLRALATVGKVDVLSRPYILASDNQLASILVGQEVPIITNSQTTDTGNIINNIEYQSIGIILNVTPHINPEGLVIMDIAPQISAISTSTVPISSSVNATVFDNTSATSRVGIRDGQTIVIGGLMQDQKTQSLSKVPILGDIPGLGLLFQRNQEEKTKTELLIFLTPHVAKVADQLNSMSQDEMKGVKLTPNAVEPGAFQEHMRGMQLGGPATQPIETTPPPPYQPASQLPSPSLPGDKQ